MAFGIKHCHQVVSLSIISSLRMDYAVVQHHREIKI